MLPTFIYKMLQTFQFDKSITKFYLVKYFWIWMKFVLKYHSDILALILPMSQEKHCSEGQN